MKSNKNILPIIVLLLSIVTIRNDIAMENYYGLFISLLGIIGSSLAIKNGKINTHFIELWFLGQIPMISFVMLKFHKMTSPIPIIDSSKMLDISFYLHFTNTEKMYFIGINIFPIICLGLLKYFGVDYQKTAS